MKHVPRITMVPLVVANTEYALVLREGIKSFSIKMRANNEFKYAYKAGDIAAGTYVTIPSGSALVEDDLSITGSLIVYLSCEKVDTGEAEYWV